MRYIIGFIGLVLSLFILGLSAFMNWNFGLTLGSSPIDQYVYGSLSVTLDGFKALLPIFMIVAWRKRAYFTLAGLTILLTASLSYSLASSLGFASKNRVATALVSELANKDLNRKQKKLKRKESQLAALPEHKNITVIASGIASKKLSSRWRNTTQCTRVKRRADRKFCSAYNKLLAEQGIALKASELESQISVLTTQVEAYEARAVQLSGDQQAKSLARILYITPENASLFMNVLVAFLLEFASSFGLFFTVSYFRFSGELNSVVVPKNNNDNEEGHKPEEVVPDLRIVASQTVEEEDQGEEINVLHYAKTRLVPVDDSSLMGKQLYADFCLWAKSHDVNPLSQDDFLEDLAEIYKRKSRYAFKNIAFRMEQEALAS